MALRNIFEELSANITRVAVQDFSNKTIAFDAVISENHSHRSTLTSHPVEDGSLISDHIIHDPIILTLRIVESNNPILLGDSLISLGSSAFGSKLTGNRFRGIAGGAITFGGSKFGSALLNKAVDEGGGVGGVPIKNRATVLFNWLYEWRVNAVPLSVFTKVKDYFLMALTSVETDRNNSNVHGLEATLTFQEVSFAEVVVSGGVVPEDSVVDSATSEKSEGTLTSDAAEQKTVDAARKKSIAATVGDATGLSDFFGLPAPQ